MNPNCSSRRHFLGSSTMNLSGFGLAWIIQSEGLLAAAPAKPILEPQSFDLDPKRPHFEPKAKAMIGWDMHDSIFTRLESACAATDKPAAGLVKDLKSRGMLDSTLVHWGGEMGRLPVVQNARTGKEPGRDHNTDGFSMWLAGGGTIPGISSARGKTNRRSISNSATRPKTASISMPLPPRLQHPPRPH